MDLRTQILQELREASDKAKAEMQKYSDDISTEMFAKSTVSGGLFADSARKSCDKRADEARKKRDAVEKANKWNSEMLLKYR